jgi:Apea-like HEPN
MLMRALAESMWETRFLLQWVALESLFGSTNPQETTYRLAQRLSLFLGQLPTDCKDLFEKAKSGYAWRSKIVHGMRLSKLTPKQSADLLRTSELLLRLAFSRVLERSAVIATFDGQGRDEYLDLSSA